MFIKKTFGFALSSVYRRPFRSVALALTVAIATGSVFSYEFVKRSITDAAVIGAERLGADIAVVPKGNEKAIRDILFGNGSERFKMKDTVAKRIKRVQGVDSVSPHLFATLLPPAFSDFGDGTLVVGYHPESDFSVTPWIEQTVQKGEGEMIAGGLVHLHQGQALAFDWKKKRLTARGLEAKEDTFRGKWKDVYARKDLVVAASMERTGSSYFDKSVFIPMKLAKPIYKIAEKKRLEAKNKRRKGGKITADQSLSFGHLFAEAQGEDGKKAVVLKPKIRVKTNKVSVVFVRVSEGASPVEVASSIEKRVWGVNAVVIRRAGAAFVDEVLASLAVLAVPALLLFTMGVVVTGIIFAAGANERSREFGLLRALGAKKIRVISIIVTESLAVAALGWLMGALLGVLLTTLLEPTISRSLGAGTWFSVEGAIPAAILAAAASTLAGIASAVYPVVKVGMAEPHDSIMKNMR